MIPKAQAALDILADKVVTGLSPVISDEFAVGDSLLISGLMKCLSQDFDRAAQVRMDDLKAMGVLFQHSLAVLEQEAGQDQMLSNIKQYLAQPQSPDLTISALTQAHSEASTLLIQLHAAVEVLDHAQQLNGAIWQYLAQHCERHQYDMALG